MPSPSQAFVTNNQKALTVTKTLVDKWFYIYGILAHIHSDKGQSFENAIISKLYSMYNIKQSMTMPYNPCRNLICERFNHALLGLLQSLHKEQKSCWPLQVLSLVFTYDATPHSLMSSCLGKKHLLFEMLGLGWSNIMIRPQPTSVHG